MMTTILIVVGILLCIRVIFTLWKQSDFSLLLEQTPSFEKVSKFLKKTDKKLSSPEVYDFYKYLDKQLEAKKENGFAIWTFILNLPEPHQKSLKSSEKFHKLIQISSTVRSRANDSKQKANDSKLIEVASRIVLPRTTSGKEDLRDLCEGFDSISKRLTPRETATKVYGSGLALALLCLDKLNVEPKLKRTFRENFCKLSNATISKKPLSDDDLVKVFLYLEWVRKQKKFNELSEFLEDYLLDIVRESQDTIGYRKAIIAYKKKPFASWLSQTPELSLVSRFLDNNKQYISEEWANLSKYLSFLLDIESDSLHLYRILTFLLRICLEDNDLKGVSKDSLRRLGKKMTSLNLRENQKNIVKATIQLLVGELVNEKDIGRPVYDELLVETESLTKFDGELFDELLELSIHLLEQSENGLSEIQATFSKFCEGYKFGNYREPQSNHRSARVLIFLERLRRGLERNGRSENYIDVFSDELEKLPDYKDSDLKSGRNLLLLWINRNPNDAYFQYLRHRWDVTTQVPDAESIRTEDKFDSSFGCDCHIALLGGRSAGKTHFLVTSHHLGVLDLKDIDGSTLETIYQEWKKGKPLRDEEDTEYRYATKELSEIGRTLPLPNPQGWVNPWLSLHVLDIPGEVIEDKHNELRLRILQHRLGAIVIVMDLVLMCKDPSEMLRSSESEGSGRHSVNTVGEKLERIQRNLDSALRALAEVHGENKERVPIYVLLNKVDALFAEELEDLRVNELKGLARSGLFHTATYSSIKDYKSLQDTLQNSDYIARHVFINRNMRAHLSKMEKLLRSIFSLGYRNLIIGYSSLLFNEKYFESQGLPLANEESSSETFDKQRQQLLQDKSLQQKHSALSVWGSLGKTLESVTQSARFAYVKEHFVEYMNDHFERLTDLQKHAKHTLFEQSMPSPTNERELSSSPDALRDQFGERLRELDGWYRERKENLLSLYKNLLSESGIPLDLPEYYKLHFPGHEKTISPSEWFSFEYNNLYPDAKNELINKWTVISSEEMASDGEPELKLCSISQKDVNSYPISIANRHYVSSTLCQAKDRKLTKKEKTLLRRFYRRGVFSVDSSLEVENSKLSEFLCLLEGFTYRKSTMRGSNFSLEGYSNFAFQREYVPLYGMNELVGEFAPYKASIILSQHKNELSELFIEIWCQATRKLTKLITILADYIRYGEAHEYVTQYKNSCEKFIHALGFDSDWISDKSKSQAIQESIAEAESMPEERRTTKYLRELFQKCGVQSGFLGNLLGDESSLDRLSTLSEILQCYEACPEMEPKDPGPGNKPEGPGKGVIPGNFHELLEEINNYVELRKEAILKERLLFLKESEWIDMSSLVSNAVDHGFPEEHGFDLSKWRGSSGSMPGKGLDEVKQELIESIARSLRSSTEN